MSASSASSQPIPPASRVWTHLPGAESRWLAIAAALMAAFYAAIAIAFALNVMAMPVGLVLGPVFALLAWGMWKLSRFARWVTVFWLWVLIVLLPIAAFTPGPAETRDEFIYWGARLAAVTPAVSLALFFAHVFGKHKREFKWP
jgi:hypothetical protein